MCTLAVIQSAVEGSPIAATVTKEMLDSTLESVASAIRGVRFNLNFNNALVNL